MFFFQGSNQLTVEGGTFSSVGRDQFNITQCSHRNDRVWTVLDEYQRIPAWKVYLKQKIAESKVRTDKRGWRNLDARRTICVAEVKGEEKEREFMHVKYSGRDASKAFKLDFDTFSAIKDTNCLQLFGYSNMNSLPALVFYDALVPVSHIWERNNFSPMLHLYFSYQAVATQGFDWAISSQELWHDPKTGFLRIGPFVRHSSDTDYELINLTFVLPDRGRSSLTLQTYNDTNVLFEYLNGTLSITDIIRGIRYSNKTFADCPNEEDAKQILPSLPGTIYHRASREVIARYPKDRRIWYYQFLERISTIPDALQGSMFTMDDGSMRFMLKPSDMRDLESFELYYVLQPWFTRDDFASSWLLQAHGIFSQLGIGEDEWGEYGTISGFWLNFKRVGEHETSHTHMDLREETPIYLFIRPIPCACDDEDIWDSWLRDAKYYWSFDSSGVDEMSDHERLNLGLPAFMTDIEVRHNRWAHEAYNALEMIHRSRGLDPTSMELAIFLGDTILEVAGGKPRFEEVDDDDWCYNSDLAEYATTDESVWEDSDTADTDHDEEVLYPRLNLCRSVRTGR